jgi:hypothetical protein
MVSTWLGVTIHCLTKQIDALPINRYKLACLGIVYGLKNQEKRCFHITQLHFGIIHRPLWIISWFIKQNSVCNWQTRKRNVHVCFHFLFPWVSRDPEPKSSVCPGTPIMLFWMFQGYQLQSYRLPLTPVRTDKGGVLMLLPWSERVFKQIIRLLCVLF